MGQGRYEIHTNGNNIRQVKILAKFRERKASQGEKRAHTKEGGGKAHKYLETGNYSWAYAKEW